MNTPEIKSTVWTPKAKRAFLCWLALVAIIDAIFLNFFVRTCDLKGISVVDRTSISLNALGLAFVLASLLVGVLAVVGWQKLEETILRDLEKSNQARLDGLERLMKGRMFSVAGYAIGELASRPDQLGPTDKEVLLGSVENCRLGYELLQQSGDRKATFFGLNNFVYYASICEEDELLGLALLVHARELRDEGFRLGFAPYLLTFCRAVLRYSSDPKEIEQAIDISSRLQASHLTSRQQAEAAFYVRELPKRMNPRENEKGHDASPEGKTP
jgi:hypothetical protein